MLASAIISHGRSIANVPNTSFFTSTDALYSLNESYKDLYSILTRENDDFYATVVTVNTSAMTADTVRDYVYKYTLPSDFYRLRLLQQQQGSIWSTVAKLTLEQFGQSAMSPGYRFRGTELWIYDQSAPSEYQIWYYPNPVALTTTPDSDITYPGTLVPEILSYQIAMDIRRKQGQPDESLQARRNELINTMIKQLNRDDNRAETVKNVFSQGFAPYI